MPEDDAVCRCDKGFNKTENGKCVGGCSLIKHYLSRGLTKFIIPVLYRAFSHDVTNFAGNLSRRVGVPYFSRWRRIT